MTEKEQRIALAKEMNWQKTPYSDIDYYVPMMGKAWLACDPMEHLNAMHQAENVGIIPHAFAARYTSRLSDICIRDGFELALWNCTAAQRAEAFLRTKGLWVE